MEHTPGPWGIGIETDVENGIGQVISPDGWHIAKVEMYPILENTRLIAAAPEMLEALKRVGCQFDMCDGPNAPFADGKTCFVCAAISKAEGRE